MDLTTYRKRLDALSLIPHTEITRDYKTFFYGITDLHQEDTTVSIHLNCGRGMRSVFKELSYRNRRLDREGYFNFTNDCFNNIKADETICYFKLNSIIGLHNEILRLYYKMDLNYI